MHLLEEYEQYGVDVINYCKHYNQIDYDFHSKLLNFLNEDSVIFDVGSNIGLFSKLICKNKAYKEIHCFEPVSKYYNICSEKLKGYNNVKFNNCGLGNMEESLTIYKCETCIGWNSFLLKDPMQPKGLLPIDNLTPEICKITTLDSYCKNNNINKIDFVKIDVEGFECKVLEGFLQTLGSLDSKPYFYIEVGWGTNHPEWSYCQGIYEELFKLGYERVNFTDKTEDILFVSRHKNLLDSVRFFTYPL